MYLGDIDTSLITDMSYLFYEDILKNKIIRIDFSGIENWDVSNVINMRNMFCKCYTFNQPLNNWDVSNVTNMNTMFFGCYTLNQDFSNWSLNKLTNINEMFKDSFLEKKAEYMPKKSN
ncbi:BspA family leucine-rich repeat surface protein [Campylobacter hyointestinalis]|nr:BspA family leucine-rich repeat surface protein [Campylobacter hyointestinalis]